MTREALYRRAALLGEQTIGYEEDGGYSAAVRMVDEVVQQYLDQGLPEEDALVKTDERLSRTAAAFGLIG